LTVYGVNRDTGVTSDPTKAMKAAVLGRSFHIRFSGATDFQYLADTAAAFIACADGAPVRKVILFLKSRLSLDTLRISSATRQVLSRRLNRRLQIL
jgi:hypothetical protein